MVEYRIDFAERNAHLVRVEARYPVAGDALELKLPVWTPGSYLVREFERHVQDVACATEDGKPLVGFSVARLDSPPGT